MNTNTDFEQLKALIESLSTGEIKKPDMPIDAFLQEAENLYQWALDDKKELVARGLKVETLNTLPIATGACRHAEGLWFKQRYGKQEAEKQWTEESPAAFELRDDLVDELEFAFNGDSALLGRVTDIKDGNTHADMIQDLTNLALLGQENMALLKVIKFDESLLQKATDTSNHLAEVLARANGDKAEDSEAKVLRDKAYTYLKKHVDEVRRYGKFVFRKNKDRVVGYRHQYKNTHRTARF